MWASWGSSRRVAAAAGLALVLGAATAVASVTVNGVVLDDSSNGARARSQLRGRPGTVVVDARAGRADTLGRGAVVVDEGNGIVRVMSDAHVRRGEHLEGDLVSIFGNVLVEGDVSGSAVAVFGHVTLAPGATVGGDAVAVVGGQRSAGRVEGAEVAVLGSVDLARGAWVGQDAVAVGGRVSTDTTAHVSGETVSVGLLPLTLGLPALPLVLATVATGWLITVFFGWLLALMFPLRLARAGITSSRRTFLSIVAAAAALFLWPVAALLCIVTIIGAPVGIVMFVAWPLLVCAGQITGTWVLGHKLLRRRLGEGGHVAPIAAGALLIAALWMIAALCFTHGGVGGAFALFFGLVALLVQVGLATIGAGAILLSRLGTRPNDVPAAPAA